jgi:drug/metabolite transporter (DMT)-like permease
VLSIVRLGWDPEIAWLLALFACGIATTGQVLLEWGVLKMPTRVSVPGFLTGVFFMVGAAVLTWDPDPDPRYIAAGFGLLAITGVWWSRARELERLKRLPQQMM